jgi:hypothetical protein
MGTQAASLTRADLALIAHPGLMPRGLTDGLAATGYTDSSAWESLEREVSTAQASGNAALLPPAHGSAVRSCGKPWPA